MSLRLPRIAWLERVDWALLRRPLALLLLALLLSAGLAGIAALARGQLQRQVQAEQAELADRAARSQRAQESASLFAVHGPAAAALRSGGFLGEEQRLTWVEALKVWQEERRIENLRYHFEPRKPWLEPGMEPVPEGGGGAGVLFATKAQIGAQLLHEGDWLALFSTLDAQARGHYTVEQCQLRRLAAGGRKGTAVEGGLEMACDLRWHTLVIEPEPE
jgi:hypothetical protein